MLLKLAYDPRSFVERQAKYPTIKVQTVIVLAVGITFGLWHLGNTVTLGEASDHVTRSIWVLSIVNFFFAFILWLVVTAAIQLLSRLIKAYFPVEVNFRLVGWGMAPLIVAGLIQSTAMLYALQDVAPPSDPEFSGFSYEYAEYMSFIDGGLSDPLFIGATILAIPFVLYSGYIWALAVSHLGDVDLRPALYVSALPTAICLLWLAFPFFL